MPESFCFLEFLCIRLAEMPQTKKKDSQSFRAYTNAKKKTHPHGKFYVSAFVVVDDVLNVNIVKMRKCSRFHHDDFISCFPAVSNANGFCVRCTLWMRLPVYDVYLYMCVQFGVWITSIQTPTKTKFPQYFNNK